MLNFFGRVIGTKTSVQKEIISSVIFAVITLLILDMFLTIFRKELRDMLMIS